MACTCTVQYIVCTFFHCTIGLSYCIRMFFMYSLLIFLGFGSNIKKRYARALTSSRGPLLDLIRHFCGRLPPGIPLNPPPCNTRTERVDRHFKELSIILAFLE